jgi:uncharacterized protein DUF4154
VAALGRCIIIAATAALLTPASPAHAQAVAGSALKAAYLYNFAKFVEWPADSLPGEAPLLLCVSGDNGVADALEDAIRGRIVDGHRVVLRRVKLDDSVRVCHVLYVSSLTAHDAGLLVDRLAGVPVLTASDLDRFAEIGGVAHLFLDGNRMRFAINLESAQRARLKVSSKLLGLAKIVKDESNAPHR